MNIDRASRGSDAFTKWAKDHLPSGNDDDQPGGATPIALAEPARRDVPENRLHRRWVMPGVGRAF